MDLEDFMLAITPEIEAEVDRRIAAEPDPADRALLRRYRGTIVAKQLDAVRIANLERKLAETEARLKPRLVPTA